MRKTPLSGWLIGMVLLVGVFVIGCSNPVGPGSAALQTMSANAKQVSASDDTDTCEAIAVGTSIEEDIIAGVDLTWTSSFLCENAPDEGRYRITVDIAHDGEGEAVEIWDLQLSHTTPRPRGQSPDASAEAVELPLEIGPGGSDSFVVTGDYSLVVTDEGKKANLHLRALGRGVDSDEPFVLGINVHIRGTGAVEDDDEDGGGPPVSDLPPVAGGPPPWAASRGR